MKAPEDIYVYIQIKLGNRFTHIIRCKTLVKRGESYNKVAKELRKDVADKAKIPPAHFSWAVFTSVDEPTPLIASRLFE